MVATGPVGVTRVVRMGFSSRSQVPDPLTGELESLACPSMLLGGGVAEGSDLGAQAMAAGGDPAFAPTITPISVAGESAWKRAIWEIGER